MTGAVNMSNDGHRLVFVGGLHRSGTTPLARLLAAHPQVSGLTGTGATNDEGQHLQDVYPPARAHGGAGRFANRPEAHLTEASALATATNAGRLWKDWSPYWDLSRPVLVEKSPPNLVMTRLLQALFPSARFLVIVRHPAMVALSTSKWRKSPSLHRLVEHWVTAHEILLADAPRVGRLRVVSYEQLISRPEHVLPAITDFLELDSPLSGETLQTHRSACYLNQWNAFSADPSAMGAQVLRTVAHGARTRRTSLRLLTDRSECSLRLPGYQVNRPQQLAARPYPRRTCGRPAPTGSGGSGRG